MIKRKGIFILFIILTIVLGSMGSSSALAKEIKPDRTQKVDETDTQSLADSVRVQAGGAATVSIVGDAFIIDDCGTIDLYIHVADVENLYALDVKVAFDPSIVEAVDLDPIAEGVNIQPVNGWIDAAYWAINNVNNATGEIHYAVTMFNPSEPANGSGNVAKISLRAKGIGTGQIRVTEATLSDRDGYLIGVPVGLGSAETITTLDVICLTGLQESNDGVSNWTALAGDLATGFIMPLDPANTYEYLDATFEGVVADGDYPFYLDELTVPDGFFAYWAGKGVVAGAGGWQGQMWEIINGRQPMFYLRKDGGEYDLIDGLSYLLDGSTTTERLKVNGDYPLGHYAFDGTIDGNYLIVGITFTRIATATIAGETFIIDDCGYIDLYIRLEDVNNLYAVDVKVQFDPAIVEAVDLDPDAVGVNLKPVNELINGAYWVNNSVDNATGVAHYAVTMFNPSLPANGSGNIARIRLRSKGTGNGLIKVTAATLSDRDGYLVGVPVELGEAKTITTQNIVCLTLRESNDNLATWQPLLGDFCAGFIMPLDIDNVYEYIDVDTFNGIVGDGDYPFTLDELSVPDDFFSYWAAKGVIEGATGWQGDMWTIISGKAPMFYLRVAGSAYDLIDGYSYMQYGPTTNERLKVNGDYPLGPYLFEGMVDGNYMFVDITFTRITTVTLGGGPFTIDGCGTIDLYINLEDVDNLYALDISLGFDPEYIEVVDLDAEAAGINLLPVVDPALGFEADYWVHNEANNTTGVIRYTTTQLYPAEPATGSGNIAKITLRGKKLGTSQITMTAATLSDRDGYLVGVPVELGSETITTTFTAASEELDLGIIRLNPTTVQLNWPAQSIGTVQSYTIHRSTLPYFTPTTGTIYQTITNNGTVATFDDPVLGNVLNNYFYTMQITCGSGLVSPYAWQVGKFEYELLETATTDFNWVGLVLETEPYWTNAAALAQHIQNNSINEFGYPVSVGSVSVWLPEGQTLSTSTFKPFPINNFPVFIKSAYRIVIDIAPLNPALTQGSIIWAQVGRLPIIESDTYTLWETATTSLNWILQPLDKTGITKAAGLASDVSAHSSAAVTVSAVSEFLESGQTFNTYNTSLPFVNNFTTRFGYPYRISINVTNDIQNPVTYPRY